jgi:DNA-binding response OmpR family regulator
MEPIRNRVLVVDHRRSVADTFVDILKFNGYEAIAVYSGEDAVAIASTYLPHAVLLDVMLPELNGLDAAQLILDQLPDCWAILMSGHPETAELIRSAKHHSVPLEVLPKPIDPQTILTALAIGLSRSIPGQQPQKNRTDLDPAV